MSKPQVGEGVTAINRNMCKTINRICLNMSETHSYDYEDLQAEAMLFLCEATSKYDEIPLYFTTSLTRHLQQYIVNEQKHQCESLSRIAVIAPSDDLDYNELFSDIRSILTSIEYTIFYYYTIEGLTFNSIALIVHKSMSRVQQIFTDAKRKIFLNRIGGGVLSKYDEERDVRYYEI